MAAEKARITQSELTRYLKAYRDAGIPIGRSELLDRRRARCAKGAIHCSTSAGAIVTLCRSGDVDSQGGKVSCLQICFLLFTQNDLCHVSGEA